MKTSLLHPHVLLTLGLLTAGTVSSCIEPPLKLPAQDVIMELPVVQLDLDVVWDLGIDWHTHWYYGWDKTDSTLWGPLTYPLPSNYELRRYFMADATRIPHTQVDGFNIVGNRFRRAYQFGYYDMLLWSNIDSPDGTQVVLVDESDLDEVVATTTVTRGMMPVGNSTMVVRGTSVLTGGTRDTSVVTGLYNQPEIFYSDYLRDVYISRDTLDYDYYDRAERCWVRQLDSELTPLVYIYLVQVIILNNDGRIRGCTGDNAISAFASGTSVNTGHTWNRPVLVYFGTRYKRGLTYEGQPADIIGGKLTTYGLCDMDSYGATRGSSHYTGTRTELHNYLYVDLQFSNSATSTLQVDVTEQCQEQAHGGIITVVLDARQIQPPGPPVSSQGSLFVPTVEDYDEVVYDIVM